MAPIRMTRASIARRRSSLAALNAIKPGVYKPISFAPNVTPVSYSLSNDNDDDDDPSASDLPKLFPPPTTPAPPPRRRRDAPGKRRSMGYIPRPPNAFMLFRADFVRQKHVPGSIETNHGSLSKIIGNCWRQLPLSEKHHWEVLAKAAKAEHKVRYPEYRFKPVHDKEKKKARKAKALPATSPQEERRCEEVAQLLCEGLKGEDLARAVRRLDKEREKDTPSVAAVIFGRRRSSSVPPAIALPSIPFFAPAPSYSTEHVHHRRASSVGPPIFPFSRPWDTDAPLEPPRDMPRDDEPLPDVQPGIFQENVFGSSAPFSFHQPQTLPSLGPLDTAPPLSLDLPPIPRYSAEPPTPQDILAAAASASYHGSNTSSPAPEELYYSTDAGYTPASATEAYTPTSAQPYSPTAGEYHHHHGAVVEGYSAFEPSLAVMHHHHHHHHQQQQQKSYGFEDMLHMDVDMDFVSVSY